MIVEANMPSESYPCYIRICESPENPDVIELPTEDDGTISLSTITAQHSDAIGLKFKSESGAWRGVPVTNGILKPPLEGWGSGDYFITRAKKSGKRKLVETDGQSSKTKKENDMLSDFIVLGLPYSTSEEELKEYFEKFGDVAHSEIKYDTKGDTKRSRGFGFVRFTDVEVAEEVLSASHSLGGRSLEVRIPNKPGHDNMPTKLFIGRLPDGTTADDLKECFSDYAPFTDVYVPKNFRNFGFITFSSGTVANEVLENTHHINGSYLNVTRPVPKAGEMNLQPYQMAGGYGNMPMQMGGMTNVGGMTGRFNGQTSKTGYYTPYYQSFQSATRR